MPCSSPRARAGPRRRTERQLVVRGRIVGLRPVAERATEVPSYPQERVENPQVRVENAAEMGNTGTRVRPEETVGAPGARTRVLCSTSPRDAFASKRHDLPMRRWISVLDWLPHSMQNLYGGESIAIDPSNPRNVYFAGGMYNWWRGGPWDVDLRFAAVER